jgi:hypothetical protein
LLSQEELERQRVMDDFLSVPPWHVAIIQDGKE